MKAKPEGALASALDSIRKAYGEGAIIRLGQDAMERIAVIPTGSIALDEALGIGGFPRGRIVELFGPESSGKTSIALHAVAQAQKLGGVAAFIDAEHAFDPEWAAALGVDTDALLVSQPDTGEQALEIADMLTCSGGVSIIVVDSVAALVPKAEIEGAMGDSHIGLQARLMSQALRKLTGSLSATGTCMVFINQLRDRVGVFFGSPETTTGGKALKFYASLRLDIRRIGAVKDGTEVVGSRVRAKAVKNKCARPYTTAEFDFMYGSGISRYGELIDLGIERGAVAKSGAWYSAVSEGGQPCRLGQGKEATRQFLADHEDIAAAIEKVIRDRPASHAARRQVTGDGPAPWESE